MDVICLRCGEPWSIDEVQHGFSKEEKERFWSNKGCPCCYGKDVELTERKKEMIMVQKAMLDVLGDDVDGLAAEMEDLFF